MYTDSGLIAGVCVHGYRVRRLCAHGSRAGFETLFQGSVVYVCRACMPGACLYTGCAHAACAGGRGRNEVLSDGDQCLAPMVGVADWSSPGGVREGQVLEGGVRV